MSYSVDLREWVLAYWNAGHTLEDTRDTYKIAVSTIREWEDRLKRTGSFEADTPERVHKKIDPEKLKKYVKEHPDAFLKEMAEAFSCWSTAVDKAPKRLHITRKKRQLGTVNRILPR